MTDSEPPKLDPISQGSGFDVPTMSSLNSDSVQDTKQSFYGSEVQLQSSPFAVECRLTPLWQSSELLA